MYRTEKWYNEVKDKRLKTPLFIASMNRPNPPLFSQLDDFSKDEVYVFIRNNPTQQEMYEPWIDKFTLVTLPDWVSDIGETREAMLHYAQQKGMESTFVFDDRIKAVRFLVPRQSRTNNMSLVAHPASFYEGLLVWERILQQYPFTLSAPSHAGFSYYPRLINAPYEVNNGIIASAININVKDITDNNLHYRPLRETGGDDFVFLVDTMRAGLPTCKITDLEYTEVPSDKVDGEGIQVDTRINNMNERVARLFSYLNVDPDVKHSWVYIRKTRDIPYPYLRWKYWQKYFQNNCIKPIPQLPSSPSTKPTPLAQQVPQPAPQVQIEDGDIYHIPGDTGKPWRFKKMVEYIGNFPDEIGPVINNWFKHNNATDDDKVWWVFLYSTCYCMGSAMVMSRELDYRHSLPPTLLEEYWTKTKPKIIFQSDRRYIKHMNQFTEMVMEFLSRTGGHLYEYISQFVTDDPETTYANLYSEISKWKYYGRFGVILFIFNLCKVFPHIQVESKVYDWKSGATTTSAIFNARYEDERANDFDAGKYALSKADIQMLDATLQIVTDELQKYKPEKKWNIIYVSSDLCSFRKLFKGVRYQGFYVDRQQEEIQTLQSNFPEHQDTWDFVWEARQKFIPVQYLGECHDWSGIRKDRSKLFLEHGYVGADPNFQC